MRFGRWPRICGCVWALFLITGCGYQLSILRFDFPHLLLNTLHHGEGTCSQEIKLPSTYPAVSVALCSGNLEFLKLLLEEWPAAQNGAQNPHMQSIMWSRFDVRVAAEKGFTECVELAVAHGCPFDLKVPLVS